MFDTYDGRSVWPLWSLAGVTPELLDAARAYRHQSYVVRSGRVRPLVAPPSGAPHANAWLPPLSRAEMPPAPPPRRPPLTPARPTRPPLPRRP